MSGREDFLRWAEAQRGKPYVWAAKGELRVVGKSVKVECYDCSGLITRGLVQCGYPRICPKCGLDLCGFHSAQRLFDELEDLRGKGLPKAGDLCFYGASATSVSHVMIWWGDDRVFGASGGNSDSTDPVVSLRKGRQVKFQPSTYRPDFLNFRSLPLPEENPC